MKLILHFFLLILFAQGVVHAQDVELEDGIVQRQVKLNLGGDKTDTLTYLEVRDSAALDTLADLLGAENFPLSIIKKPVIDPFFDLILNYESQLDDYRQLEQHYKTLDGIQIEKINQVNQIIKLQNERVENYRLLSEDLRTTNKELSAQLDQALAVAKTCNNDKVKKQWRIAILGGAVGFSVASLIALID